MTKTTRRDVIDAAMAMAEDAAQGRLDPAELESDVATVCRELVADVRGPDDPLWGVQLDVCRGVLAARGIPVDELAEWLAVARRGAAESLGLLDPDEGLRRNQFRQRARN